MISFSNNCISSSPTPDPFSPPRVIVALHRRVKGHSPLSSACQLARSRSTAMREQQLTSVPDLTFVNPVSPSDVASSPHVIYCIFIFLPYSDIEGESCWQPWLLRCIHRFPNVTSVGDISLVPSCRVHRWCCKSSRTLSHSFLHALPSCRGLGWGGEPVGTRLHVGMRVVYGCAHSFWFKCTISGQLLMHLYIYY